jgi:iron complex outermembrane recepter protein
LVTNHPYLLAEKNILNAGAQMVMKGAAGAACTAAFALLVALPAQAQTNPNAIEEIVVTAQQKRKQVVSDGSIGVLGNKIALETPFNVTTYTAQLILDQQSETLGDVLKNEPTVRTTFGSGNQSELFVIRGFPLAGDDVSIDGLYGVTPRQIVSPELYENVQVLNGANAFLFGAAPSGSGIGGSINLIPKRAGRTLMRATASYGADGVFGGNFDLGMRFGQNDMFGARVMGVFRKGDTPIDRERREARVAGAGFDLRSERVRASLDFGFEDQRAYEPRPEVQLAAALTTVPRVPDSTANYAQPWTFTKLRDVYAINRYEVDITRDWMAYVSGGFRDGREEGDYSTITVTNPATGAATQSRLFVPRRDHNRSAQSGVRGKVTFGGISNELNLGGSINYTENRNAYAFAAYPAALRASCGSAATAVCTNLYNPVLVDKPPNGTVGGNLSDPPPVAKTLFRSLFFSDTIGILDDRVLLTAGARRQFMKIDNFDRNTFARTAHYSAAQTTPVVGLTVRPTEDLSIYANRIEGMAQGPTAPVNANTLNPGQVFPPFTSTQYEIGVKYAVHGLTATVALYQTTQPNAFNKPTPTPGNPNATTFVVEGEQRNRGVEVSFNGELTDQLRFIGGLTYNNAEQMKTLNGLNNGKKAVGVPDYQVNLGFEAVLPFLPAATLTGRVVYTDSQYLNVTNTQKLPSWTRFDIGMRYVLVADTHPVTLRLSIENIDDRRYWASGFGGYLVQGQPRTIKASTTFEF